MKRIEFLFDKGTAKEIEDGFFISEDLFAVFDGVSTPYSRKRPKQLIGFDKVNSGTWAVRKIIDSFSMHRETWSLSEILHLTNVSLLMGSWEPLELRPGATFAAAQIHKNHIEIAQIGDSCAVWKYKDGTCFATKNQLYEHDVKWCKPTFRGVMKKHMQGLPEVTNEKLAEVRASAWDEYCELWVKKRTEDVNNKESLSGFGLLNGDPRTVDFWFSTILPVKNLELIVLFTDGLIDSEKTESENALARYIVDAYNKFGLTGMLQEKREHEILNVNSTFISHTEATAIAIEF